MESKCLIKWAALDSRMILTCNKWNRSVNTQRKTDKMKNLFKQNEKEELKRRWWKVNSSNNNQKVR